MKKFLFVLSLASFPLVVCAQTTEKPAKILVEQYQPADQALIDLGKKHAAEMNKDIDANLKEMSKKQKAVMVDSLKNMERRKVQLTGDDSEVIEIKGDGDAAIKDFFDKASAPDLFVPFNEPELVEVDIDSAE